MGRLEDILRERHKYEEELDKEDFLRFLALHFNDKKRDIIVLYLNGAGIEMIKECKHIAESRIRNYVINAVDKYYNEILKED